MPPRTLLLLAFLSLPILLLTSHAQKPHNTSLCTTSSCGTTTITYPFRLRSDPPDCGFPDPFFALECHTNSPIITIGSQHYNVQAITYGNYSIRLTDPGITPGNYSTCPTYPSLDYGNSSQYMTSVYIYNIYFAFITCSRPVNNPAYVANPSCGNATAFPNASQVYGYVAENVNAYNNLDKSCVVDKEVHASSATPFEVRTYPYSTIHDFLSHGFEFSWYQVYCGDCNPANGRCSVENGKVRCRHYCFEHTPLSERSFRCKLEYYYPYIFLIILPAIGGILLLRCLCGVSFAVAVLRSRRRKQQEGASMADEEDKSQAVESIA
ncbi:uncharacterized protein LOC127256206 isoform X2 [Andrographis paniculata]|uniref:uncharacterized protein LOC127256206 isoform X2 n=1 Tax=Andrographis paniculata TaxID=175694 RepID=UPI0021E9A699|nr:uncharacterized protein LOC127256206 isoform X2 [Andrographis paniculata]